MKNKAFKIIKMLTCSTQHREVWMQSKDTILLLLFAREDSRDVRVLSEKINFSSGQCMLWGPEQEQSSLVLLPLMQDPPHNPWKAAPTANWGISRYLQKVVLAWGQEQQFHSIQLEALGSYLLCLWSDQSCSRNRSKEVDILTNPLDLMCSAIDSAVLC